MNGTRWLTSLGRRGITYAIPRWKALVGLVLAMVGFGVGGSQFSLYQFKENPSLCASCHIIKSYYESWSSSDLLDNVHGTEGLKCKDCHQAPLPQLAQELLTTITGNYENPLREREFPTSDCFGCHSDHQDLASVIEHTEDIESKYPDLKNRALLGEATHHEELNPHDSHFYAPRCGTCHKMHRVSVDLCQRCHDVSVGRGPQWTQEEVTK